jgi:hypothetical protein
MSDQTPTPGSGDAPTGVSPPAPRDDGFDFDLDAELPPPPPRPRRRPLLTNMLVLCAAVGIGVIGGVLIEKHWGGGGSGGGTAGGRAAAFAALAGRGGQTGGSGGTTGGRAGGFARNGTVGQVKTIDGKNLYITDLQGNVLKVTTGPGVRVRVTSDGTIKKVFPGDYVTVQGAQTATGYTVTSITDTGTESPVGGGLGAFGGSFSGEAPSGTGGSGSGSGSGGSGSAGGSGGGTTSLPALPGLGGG